MGWVFRFCCATYTVWLRIVIAVFSRELFSAAAIFCLSVTAAGRVAAAEFFVSPAGSPAGEGTLLAPWDLQTALSHPTNVAPGDVVWLKGGIYRNNNQVTRFVSSLAGAPGQPITVRQYPGERATIDGYIIQQSGGWVDYWGFEIINSHPNRLTSESGPFPTAFYVVTDGQTNDLAVSGFDLRAPHVKLINLVVHDSIGGGVGVSVNATDAEIYGTVCYYNGWQGCDRGHGHGLYIQSADPGSAIIADNLFLANYALGIQATGEGEVVDNLSFEGNVIFLNGVLARRHQGNFLLGPAVGLAKNPVLLRNFVYDGFGNASDVNIGYSGGSTNAVVLENYFQTSVHFSELNLGMVLASNTFIGGTLFLEKTNYPDNVYLDTPPATNHIEVRTNKYELNRAHIIVYNWENSASVSVNVSDFLPIGTSFEVRNAQNYMGAPLLNGFFTGDPLELPLTNLAVAKPIGTNTPLSTAPPFNCFILKPREESADPNYTNSAPVISSITDQVIDENTTSESLPLVIEDGETPAAYLMLSVLSSNPQLVPNKNISITGIGTNRTVTLAPATNQVGSSLITLTASDGFLSAETSFNLEVLPGIDLPPDTNEVRATLAISLSGTNAIIRLQGLPNVDYQFGGSTNLVTWEFISTISTDCDGKGNYTDPNYFGRPARFYRAIQQP